MTRTDTTGVATDTMSRSYHKVHPHSPISHLSERPSSSTTLSDLSGFDCNIGPPHHHNELYTKNYRHRPHDLERGSGVAAIQFPPSPPPTNSDPKRSVPLPVLSSTADPGPSSLHPQHTRHFEGSTVMKHMDAPLTPPPTLPTPTHALPPAETEPSFIYTHYEPDSSLFCLPSSPTSPDQGRPAHRLLSPLSPEWSTNRISYEGHPSPHFDCDDSSVLLYGNHDATGGAFDYRQESHDGNNFPGSRPMLPLLDIPELEFSPKSTWNGSPTSAMDIDYDDEELDLLSTPTSPSSSPFLPKLDLESDDLMFGDEFPEEKYQSFPHPSPPLIHQIHFLPELDDIPTSPTSPSLRSFSSLPDADDEDSDELMLILPSSPARTLISLPGADTDDDLLPPDLAFPLDTPRSPYSSSSSSTSSLLLLDDPTSPEPDPDTLDFDFDLELDPLLVERSADPDVRRLAGLRGRSLAAERAARRVENAMLEQGRVHLRWEARRTRKREKERGREIGAMLRLKLGVAEEQGEQGMEVEMEGEKAEGEGKKKRAISSMEQLVAKMMLRRNETYRSLANRKTPLTAKFHTSSPLARYAAVLPDDTRDNDLDLDAFGRGSESLHDIDIRPASWTMDLDSPQP